jgi:P27 family predicted phage terminase small subunit
MKGASNMPTGYKKSIYMHIAEGNKSARLTKAEIAERLATEPIPVIEGIAPPESLTTEKQINDFWKFANQLKELRTLGESDCEALGAYVLERERYMYLSRKLNSKEAKDDMQVYEKILNQQDKVYKHFIQLSKEFGFTPFSRTKCAAKKAEQEEKVNRFAKFGMEKAE